MDLEHAFTCPHCWQTITMQLDLSEDGPQAYVEDCEACGRPIALAYEVVDGELDDFVADALDD